MAEKEIKIYLTGAANEGDAQDDPNSSLGGKRSQTVLNAILAAGLQNVTGVTIDEISPACGAGAAALSFTLSTTSLRFTAPGDTAGASVDVSVDGTYEVYSTDTTKYVIVTVVSASLPTADQADALTFENNTDNLFAFVSPEEAQAGSTKYRAVMLKNDSAYTMYGINVWISQNTPFPDDAVKIAIEAPDANGEIQLLASETSAPSGVTFYGAADEANGLAIGDMASGKNYGVWIERVLNSTSSRYADNGFTLTFKASTV